MVLEATLQHETTNDLALSRFAESIKAASHDSELSLPPEEIDKTIEIFGKLHELVNDPTTRETKAQEKAELIEQLAREVLSEHESSEFQLEIIKAVHQETGVETFNTVVTFGDPSTGPNTILEVHHDTIAASDYKLQTSGEKLVGRTVQDNTVHAAAMLNALKDIRVPQKGAITVVFTDFEENGCRGSTAIKEQLFDRSGNFPMAFVALESTEGKLATGHRGKLSSEVRGKSGKDIFSTFASLYEVLSSVEHDIYDQSGETSTLGKTTGTSTCGYVNGESVWGKLDFRTNDVVTPQKVQDIWEQCHEGVDRRSAQELIDDAKQSWSKGISSVEVTQQGILIKTESKHLHPSTFNPKENQTSLPILYLVLQSLEQMEMGGQIKSVAWGEKSKQNSNPVSALVEGEFTFTTEALIQALEQLDRAVQVDSDPEASSLDESQTIKTGGVASPHDEVVENVRTSLGNDLSREIELTTMNFMTDIAGIYNLAKDNGRDVYGFIYGVGDPAKLHQTEEVTASQFLEITTSLKSLLNNIQEKL